MSTSTNHPIGRAACKDVDHVGGQTTILESTACPADWTATVLTQGTQCHPRRRQLLTWQRPMSRKNEDVSDGIDGPDIVQRHSNMDQLHFTCLHHPPHHGRVISSNNKKSQK